MIPVPILYAALLAAGGIMGYVKVGSVISLAMGCGSGATVIILDALSVSHPKASYIGLLTVSSGLAVMMGMRAWKASKFMPAGLVSATSVAMAVWLLTARTGTHAKTV